MIKIRRFISSIKTVYKWFPIIWKDQQWDYHYIYIVLHKKLELMDKFFNSDDTHIRDAEKVAAEIRLVKEALDRLITDQNWKTAMKEYYDKYGYENLFSFNKDGSMDLTDDKEQLKLYDNSSGLAHRLDVKDRELVFDYMRDNIEKWWD